MEKREGIFTDVAFERAMEALKARVGADRAAVIRPIARRNCKSPRLQKHLEKDQNNSIDTFITHIAAHYQSQHAYVAQVQTDRFNEVWDALLQDVNRLCRKNLIKSGITERGALKRMLADSIYRTTEAILRSSFHYDSEFMAWVATVARNQCTKAIAAQNTFGSRLINNARDLDVRDVAYVSAEATRNTVLNIEKSIDLRTAITQVCSEREIKFLELYYGQNFSADETAQYMQCTKSAVYNLNTRVKNKLREKLV